MLKMITEEVPGELKDYYEPTTDGKFKLKVEGAVSAEEYKAVKSQIKEFRDNNVKLKETVETFTNVFGDGKDLTPDAITKKISDRADALAVERAAEMKTKLESKIADLEKVSTEVTSKYSRLVLGKQIQDAVTKHGVHSSAIDDVLRRANEAFELKDDQVVYKSKDLDADGKPYTVDSWAAGLAKTAPHLFAPSQGSGAFKPAAAGGSTQLTGTARIAAGLAKNGNGVKRIT